MGSVDLGFKSFGETNPAALVRIFSGLPWDLPLPVTPLEREVIVPFRAADLVLKVEFSAETWIYHFESETHGDQGGAQAALIRSAALGLKYRLPVQSHLILLSRRRPALTVQERQSLTLGRPRSARRCHESRGRNPKCGSVC